MNCKLCDYPIHRPIGTYGRLANGEIRAYPVRFWSHVPLPSGAAFRHKAVPG